MSDNRNKFTQSSSEFSDDAIRRFLLGQLNVAEQLVFEQCLFTRDELEARVRLAEFDLTDDYVYERLPRTDEERVRRNFLLSADRQRAVAVSKALRSCFAPKAESQGSIVQRLRHQFGVNQPVWRYAFAGLLLMLVFATVWRGIREPRLVEQVIPKRVAPKPASTQTPQETHHPATSSSSAHVEQSPVMPAHQAVVLNVLLDSKSTSDNPAIVNHPRKDDVGVVRFQLVLEHNQQGPYRAELFTANGESIFSADSLEPADGSKISFDVSAGLLKSGDHQVKLTRISNGSSEVVPSYYFRVQ